MTKITVTQEEVKDNMKNYKVRTATEFDKPVTYVTVRMKNGFTLRESTTCVDPANYDENIGAKICLEKIEDKVWFLLGYALQDKISKEAKELKKPYDYLLDELNLLSDNIERLKEQLCCPACEINVGVDEFRLMTMQLTDMLQYKLTLKARLTRLGILVFDKEGKL